MVYFPRTRSFCVGKVQKQRLYQDPTVFVQNRFSHIQGLSMMAD